MVIDLDSTICEVCGKAKDGAGYGYTNVLGYHPLLATRADTGEVLHARLRKGSANTRGAVRFVEELVARVRRAGAAGELIMRFDSGFWSIAPSPPSSASTSATPWASRYQTRGQRHRGHRRVAWTPIDYTRRW